VEKVWIGGQMFEGSWEDWRGSLPPVLAHHFIRAICLNTTAFWSPLFATHSELVNGSVEEYALLNYICRQQFHEQITNHKKRCGDSSSHLIWTQHRDSDDDDENFRYCLFDENLMIHDLTDSELDPFRIGGEEDTTSALRIYVAGRPSDLLPKCQAIFGEDEDNGNKHEISKPQKLKPLFFRYTRVKKLIFDSKTAKIAK